MIRLKTLLEQDSLDVMYNPVLFYNLDANKTLIALYKQIQDKLKDKFTEEHFKAETTMSGGFKPAAGRVNSTAMSALTKLQEQYPTVTINRNSKRALYRDYVTQADLFVEVAMRRGGTISGAMRQAALPGFSQHHTGKAFDIKGYDTIDDNILDQFGFERPYLKASKWRISEPWHIYYKK
jgi:hypothetical protein